MYYLDNIPAIWEFSSKTVSAPCSLLTYILQESLLPGYDELLLRKIIVNGGFFSYYSGISNCKHHTEGGSVRPTAECLEICTLDGRKPHRQIVDVCLRCRSSTEDALVWRASGERVLRAFI